MDDDDDNDDADDNDNDNDNDDNGDNDDNDDGMDEGNDYQDSLASSPGVPNSTSDSTTEWSAAMSFGLGYLMAIGRSPNPVSTAPVPKTVEAINDPDVDGLDSETIDLDPLIPPIDSNDGGTHQVSTT